MIQCCADALVGLGVELKVVLSLQRLKHCHAVIGRTIVDDDDSEILIVLGEDARHGNVQILFCVVAGRNDRYEGNRVIVQPDFWSDLVSHNSVCSFSTTGSEQFRYDPCTKLTHDAAKRRPLSWPD